MQNRLIILLISLTVSFSSFADTCPPIEQINVDNPPPGWTMLIPPAPIEGQQYHFGKAIHSYNGNFFYKHVLCVYEVCDFMCPAFSLLSVATYDAPKSVVKNWDQPPIVQSTFTCAPADNDPSVCVFE